MRVILAMMGKIVRRLAAVALISFALLSGCYASNDTSRPVKLVLKEGAPPASWEAGDRVAVEGKLTKSDGEPYVLRFTVENGRSARRHCAVIRGIEGLGLASRLKANWLTNGDTLVRVTGVTLDERHPRFRFAQGGGAHLFQTCTFAMQIEKVQTL